MIRFGEIRKIVSHTDAIQIMLTSIGDVDKSYTTIDLVPDHYNSMPVIGFCNCDSIYVDQINPVMKGIEFYLLDNPDDYLISIDSDRVKIIEKEAENE